MGVVRRVVSELGVCVVPWWWCVLCLPRCISSLRVLCSESLLFLSLKLSLSECHVVGLLFSWVSLLSVPAFHFLRFLQLYSSLRDQSWRSSRDSGKKSDPYDKRVPGDFFRRNVEHMLSLAF